MVGEFAILLVYLVVSLILSLVLVGSTMLLVDRSMDIEKISAYECGFHPFEDTRAKFDVRFYLVAILFIIFDLEIMFLFPWSLVVMDIGVKGYVSMCVFLFILLVGFFYEWNKGALEWE
tara:strand:+ start:385 stop:741 length:357 start_codon:yes stop_codon:yes gene_type:complete